MAPVLDSITVVSLEQAVAAPLTTRHLSDLGARVVKIERPGVGDFARHYDTTVHGESSYFVWLNRGKESITIDIGTDDGREIVRDLLSDADVFVQNLGPGAAQRAGFGVQGLRADFPQLICCTISGYGTTGAWSHRKAYDLLVQNESGLVSVTGTKDVPAKAGTSVADIAAGMYAFSGILCALLQRARTGTAPSVHVSLFEALTEWMAQPYNYAHYGGEPPRRTGAEHATITPYGPYATRDGTVVIAIQNRHEWQTFCTQVIDDPALADDPRFATNHLRVANRGQLHELVAHVIAKHTTAQMLESLDSAGIANARQNDVASLDEHPALTSRNRWREVSTPSGPIAALLPPVDLGDEEMRMGPVPALGQHTRSVLQQLGHTEERIAELIERGVV